MEGGNFFEQLHDQYEQIEIETDHRADHVDPAPCTDQMPGTARENCDREKWQRNDPKTDGRRKSVERKEESSDSCQNGRGQKPFRPVIEAMSANHSKQNDNTCENSHETNERVNDCVDLQDHGVSPFIGSRTPIFMTGSPAKRFCRSQA